jgi:hypothetical protein
MLTMPELSTSIPLDASREALRRVLDATPHPAGPDDSRDREILAALIAEWDAEHLRYVSHVRCPACHVTVVHRAFASEHVAHCPSHPAAARLRASIAALRVAPELVAALGGAPVRVDPTLIVVGGGQPEIHTAAILRSTSAA